MRWIALLFLLTLTGCRTAEVYVSVHGEEKDDRPAYDVTVRVR